MGLDVKGINKHLKAEFGAYEDSLQDAWVEILERNLQATSEIGPIARKVRNRAVRQYLNRKYREECLQSPLGRNGDESFSLESILPAPVSDDSETMEGNDVRGNDVYERMVDFLIREYLKQKLKGAYFLIMTPDPDDTGKVKTLLESWYARHAKRLFPTRLEQCYESARRLKVPFPALRVQKMKKRWGSCGKQGKIILNTALVKAPLSSIDYVIMHELCHLKIRQHNERYYRMLRELMPDWEKRKARLEQTQA